MARLLSLRVLELAVAMSVACWVLLSVAGGAQHARAARSVTGRAYFANRSELEYTGRQRGGEDFYGFISPTKPNAKTGHLSWEYWWAMDCHDFSPGLRVGSQFGCDAPVRMGGWEELTFTDPVLGQDCTAKITNRPNARWHMGGRVKYVTEAELSASPPYAEIAVIPTPAGSNCNGPDEAIKWKEEDAPNIKGVAQSSHGFFAISAVQHGQYISRGVVRGHVESESEMAYEVAYNERDWFRLMLENAADQAELSLSVSRDQMNGGVANSNVPEPSVRPGVSGTLSGQGTAVGAARHFASGASATLFTIHQHVGPGSTTVALRLTPAGRRFLATAGAVKIRISLTFKPAHRSAVSVQRVVSLRPPLPSSGSPGPPSGQITSVKLLGPATNPSFVVKGTDLGPKPAPDRAQHPSGINSCPVTPGDNGYDYGTNLYIAFPAKNWSGGRYQPSLNETDCIDLVVTKFTQSEVDFHFGPFYVAHSKQFPIANGDEAQVVVNGAEKTVHMKYGSAVSG